MFSFLAYIVHFKTERDRKINWYSCNHIWKVNYLENFRMDVTCICLYLNFSFNLKVSFRHTLKGEVNSWLNTSLKWIDLRSPIVQGFLENLFLSVMKSCSVFMVKAPHFTSHQTQASFLGLIPHAIDVASCHLYLKTINPAISQWTFW